VAGMVSRSFTRAQKSRDRRPPIGGLMAQIDWRLAGKNGISWR
jgi:hypothetical protein